MLKKIFTAFLILGTTLSLSACGGFPVAALVVGGTGAAINVENSGNPVDSPKEAFDRTKADVEKGFNGSKAPDGRYGPIYETND